MRFNKVYHYRGNPGLVEGGVYVVPIGCLGCLKD